MKHLLLLISLCFCLFPVQAQSSHWIRTGLDNYQYQWSADELQKTDPEGKVVYTWQQPAGGDITWVDPANPFRILIFIRQADQILWLNNKLSPVAGPIFLPDYGINNPLAAASAKDGGLWILDGATANLIKFSTRMKNEFQVPIRLPQTNYLIQMAEWKDYLAILFPGQSLWIADLYGQFLKKIQTAASSLGIQTDGIMLGSGTEHQVYRPDNGTIKSLIKKP